MYCDYLFEEIVRPALIICILINTFYIVKIHISDQNHAEIETNNFLEKIITVHSNSSLAKEKIALELFVFLSPGENLEWTLKRFYDRRIHIHEYRCGIPISSYHNLTIDCNDDEDQKKSCLLFDQLQTRPSLQYFGRLMNSVTINEYQLVRLLNYLNGLDSKRPYAVGKVWRYNQSHYLGDELFLTNSISDLKCSSQKFQKNHHPIWQGRLEKYSVIDLSPYLFGNFC